MEHQRVKKLALVANTTWNIFNFRQNVIRKFVDMGHEVYVLAPIDEYIEYKENFPAVEHINLKNLDRDGVNPIKDYALIKELTARYREIKPDIVIHYTHKPNIYGAIAARAAGVKSISVITGLGYSFIHKGWINTVVEKLYWYTSQHTEAMIFENEDDKNYFVDKKLIAPNKAYAIKGCGVDTQYYSDENPQKPNGHTVFTFIGRLLKDKGIGEFVTAAKYFKKRNNKLKFVVLGDFDVENPSTIDREQFLSWINEEVIDYKGFVNDIRPYIQQSNCIVLPSYREGMPRIILESMSMQKPIITTDTAGCRETVVDGVNGFMVKVQDSNSLIEAMQQFVKLSRDQQQKMGVAGRQMIEQDYSDVIIANKVYDIVFGLEENR